MKYETLQKTPKRLKKVEELFGIAEEILEQTKIPENTEETAVEIIPADYSTDLEESNSEDKLPRLFNLDEVRHDFILARRNLFKLMKRCQDLMDQTTEFDITDMKSGQIEATATLANSVTAQIQLVMTLYKDLAQLEVLRTPPQLKNKESQDNPNSDIVFIGDSKTLVELIEENS